MKYHKKIKKNLYDIFNDVVFVFVFLSLIDNKNEDYTLHKMTLNKLLLIIKNTHF